MRQEFSTKTRREALERCKGHCEGCGATLWQKARHFDHDIADGLGGEPTLENCKVLCVPCHDDKTRKHDVPRIAKAKRVYAKHNGIAIKSRGFAKRPPQRTASRPIRRAHADAL
jgi:5-methylcytosine-specific restriction protein A